MIKRNIKIEITEFGSLPELTNEEQKLVIQVFMLVQLYYLKTVKL
jgi:hypothetical protein